MSNCNLNSNNEDDQHLCLKDKNINLTLHLFLKYLTNLSLEINRPIKITSTRAIFHAKNSSQKTIIIISFNIAKAQHQFQRQQKLIMTNQS